MALWRSVVYDDEKLRFGCFEQQRAIRANKSMIMREEKEYETANIV